MSKTKYRFTVREVLDELLQRLKFSGLNRGEDDFDELESILQETVEEKWKPKIGLGFYYVNIQGDIDFGEFDNKNEFDNWRLKTGNCFPYTKQGKKQAEEYREKLISLNK